MGDVKAAPSGPELTAIASRFSRHDVFSNSILEPMWKVISEQYEHRFCPDQWQHGDRWKVSAKVTTKS